MQLNPHHHRPWYSSCAWGWGTARGRYSPKQRARAPQSRAWSASRSWGPGCATCRRRHIGRAQRRSRPHQSPCPSLMGFSDMALIPIDKLEISLAICEGKLRTKTVFWCGVVSSTFLFSFYSPNAQMLPQYAPCSRLNRAISRSSEVHAVILKTWSKCTAASTLKLGQILNWKTANWN
jgi:hypothetical protein